MAAANRDRYCPENPSVERSLFSQSIARATPLFNLKNQNVYVIDKKVYGMCPLSVVYLYRENSIR